MALLLKKIYQGYFWIFEECPDPRANDYFLIKSLFHVLPIGFIYLYFCRVVGPKYMKSRPPYNLKYILILFNISQVLINAYVAIEIFLYFPKMDFRCAEIDYSNDQNALRLLRVVYLYFIMKLMDLLDTVFFVLRKKQSQVTFLHVYHHFGMLFGSWIAMKFFGGGATVIIGFVNAIVHIVMYCYYLLSAYDSNYKNSVWWKKHITQLQLVQFLFFIIYFGRYLFITCSYPKFIPFLFVPQNFFMLCLFGEFYYRQYIQGKKTKDIN